VRLSELTDLKSEGNSLFSKKDIEGALAKFAQVSSSVEVNFTNKLNAKNEEVL
jgi:hypothetical protein